MKFLPLLLLFLMPISAAPSPSPQKDVPAEVDAARQALKNANNELEHAGGDWGGHRVNAMKHIQEAITELNAAETWAKQHHDIK